MCLGFPGKIISIDENKLAIIDISGTRREARLDLVDDDTVPGDYVICHAGYAIHKIDEELAREMLDCLKAIFESETN
ncbi:MAG: HypC/HybG/HupF family hydrogenase formation chaperone [Syntrophales bacterium]|jgi:hydrogenase expression/formation protein HypC